MENNENKRYIKVCLNLFNNENFMAMSIEAKLMLTCIYDWLDSLGQLENDTYFELPVCSMTEESVISAIKELKKYGFITKERV